MSFLSAMEPRSLQAGPVGASLLPPFRPPSWPAGENTSTVYVLFSRYHLLDYGRFVYSYGLLMILNVLQSGKYAWCFVQFISEKHLLIQVFVYKHCIVF